LITLLVSGGAPATLYVAWASYRDSQRDTGSKDGLDLAEVTDQLAAAVRAQWTAEARVRRLNDPYPLPVSWAGADGHLAESWDVLVRLASSGRGWPASSSRWNPGPDGLAGNDRDLADVLERIPTGRLVVLGAPGAGKTMLMVGLVLDLLARRTSGGPVPVLVQLASWDPARQSLHGWLAAQLLTDHPSLAAAMRSDAEGSRIDALLDAGLLLLILDGLDEVPDAARGLAVTAINAGLRPGEKAIVTCRTDEYAAVVRPQSGLGTTMHGAAVVELAPLDNVAVCEYLRDTGGPLADVRWAPVTSVLGTQSPAAQALTTPLMIGLARTVYNPCAGEQSGDLPDPAQLCDEHALPDRASVERHLFDAFIPAAYRTTPGWPDRRHRRWAPALAERWLIFIARHLENTVSSQGLAWWRLQEAAPRTVNIMAAVLAGFVGLGLTEAATAGSHAGTTSRLCAGLSSGLAAGAATYFMGHKSRAPLTLQHLGHSGQANGSGSCSGWAGRPGSPWRSTLPSRSSQLGLSSPGSTSGPSLQLFGWFSGCSPLE
jgi:hypothetical protein